MALSYWARDALTTPGRRPFPPDDRRREPQYFSAIAASRLTRLPRLFARSTLYRSVYRSQVKSPSLPYEISFARYSRKGSAPNRAATSVGSRLVPSDLLI